MIIADHEIGPGTSQNAFHSCYSIFEWCGIRCRGWRTPICRGGGRRALGGPLRRQWWVSLDAREAGSAADISLRGARAAGVGETISCHLRGAGRRSVFTYYLHSNLACVSTPAHSTWGDRRLSFVHRCAFKWKHYCDSYLGSECMWHRFLPVDISLLINSWE